MFDLLIQLDRYTDDELAHMAYFGLTHMLTTTSLDTPPTHGKALCDYWDQELLLAQPNRAKDHGLTTYPALGISSKLDPTRTFADAIPQLLKRLTSQPRPIIGLLNAPSDTPQTWSLLIPQLQLLHELPLARAILCVPHDLAINQTYKVLQHLEEHQLPLERVAIVVPTVNLAVAVAKGGAWPVLDVQRDVDFQVLATAIAEHAFLEEKLLCCSGLHRASRDILAIPKAVDRMQQAGVLEAKRFVTTNARQFLGEGVV